MGIHEAHQAYGDFTVSLSKETPVEILKALDEGMFGTVYITPRRIGDEVHPKEVARYAGIMRSREFTDTQRVIGGSGLVWLLGDPNTPGPGIDETAIDLTGQSFVTAITNVLADTDLVPGNIIAETGGLPNGRFIGHTARYKLERILAQYSEAEYKVTPKAELDAGTPASLFDTFNNPTVFIKRGASGVDPDWKGVPLQSGSMGKDLTNWANRKLLVNNQNEEFTIVGSADEATSFRGPNGTLLSFTDISVESEQDQANADERAAALLGHLVKERKVVRLTTENYDVFGSFGLGDTLFVWEPEIGFYDLANKIEFRGQYYFPLALRVYGFDWPIKEGMGVWFQTSKPSADLFDLTDYFIPEEGQTTIDVGSAARTLVPSPTEPLGPVVAPITNPSDPPPAPDSPTIFGNERQLLVQAPVTSGGNPLPTNVRKLNVYASTTTGFTPGPTNLIGYISVSRGNIKLGTDVIKRFPWPEDQQTYVRISAVNDAAEGPASAEVAVTAGLIPDAAILNLRADKITAGTISAAIEILSPTITGGLFRTSVTGERIEMAEGTPDQVRWFSGLAAESSNAFSSSNSTLAGGGRISWATRSAISTSRVGESVLWLASGGTSADAAGEIQAYDSVASPTWLSRLSVTRNQAWLYAIDPAGTFNDAAGVFIDNSNPQLRLAVDSRRVSLTSTTVALYYGNTSTDPALFLTTGNPQFRLSENGPRVSLTSSSAALHYGASTTSPRFVARASDAEMSYRSGGRRVKIDVDKAQFVGSDNVAKMEVWNDRIACYQGLAMHKWALWTGPTGTLSRLEETGTGFVALHGEAQTRIISVNDNIQIRVGGFSGSIADCVDIAASVYREFKADVTDMCDGALKNYEGPSPTTLSDVLNTEFGMFSRRSNPNEPAQIGFAAETAPSYLTTEASIMTGKGKGRRHMRGMKPNAGVAWLGKALQELYVEVDKRLKSLEGAE